MRNHVSCLAGLVVLGVVGLSAGVGRGAPPDAKAAPVAVPAEAEQRKSAGMIQEIFRQDLAAARTLEQRAAVAAKMLKLAREPDTSTNDRYVLLIKSRDLAADSADLLTTIVSIVELSQRFGARLDAMAAETMPRVLKSYPRDRDPIPLINGLLALTDTSIKDDRYDLARVLVAQAATLSARTNDPGTATRVNARAVDVRLAEAAYQDYARAMAVLATNPADPLANAAAGRYLCFVKADWAAGLPHLAAGSDPGLKTVAKLEIGPDAPGRAEQLADGWWEESDRQRGRNRDQVAAHAAQWYKTALPTLAGLAKAKAEKRIAEAAARPTAGQPGHDQITEANLRRTIAGLDRMTEQQWAALGGKTFTVSASPADKCETGITMLEGRKYAILPCPTDRWNSSPSRWKNVDFRGHRDTDERTRAGQYYMQLCWRADDGKLHPVDDDFVARGPGKLLLVPSDLVSNGNTGNNTGKVRVKVLDLVP